MKSYWVRRVDGKLDVAARDVPVPTPKVGERLIRVCASSLNRGELLLAGSEWKAAGVELAGEDVATGQRLMGRCRGGFSEYAILDERETLPIPDSLSYEQAAAIPLTFLLAYDILCVQSQLGEKEWLLVVGVSSGVGVSCLLLGKLLGACVAGTSTSLHKLKRLAAVGLDLPLHGPDWPALFGRETAGKGAAVAVNAVGGSLFPQCLSALSYEGQLAVVGTVDGMPTTQLDVAVLHEKRLRVFGVSNRLRSADDKAKTVAGFRRDVLPSLEQGQLVPLIDSVHSFSDLARALSVMESGSHCGKIVVTW